MWNDGTQTGIIIVTFTVGGMLIGKLADGYFRSAPIGILAGIFIGVTLASVFIVWKFQKIIKNEAAVYNKGTSSKKGGVTMDECEKCGHKHEGPCECGCTVTKCPDCGHMHGDVPCPCGCGK